MSFQTQQATRAVVRISAYCQENGKCLKIRAYRKLSRTSADKSGRRMMEGNKHMKNNLAILRAWDRFSQFMTVTRKALDGVEFMRLEMVDAMRGARKFFANQKRFWRDPERGPRRDPSQSNRRRNRATVEFPGNAIQTAIGTRNYLYGRIQRTFPHHLRCVRASHPTAKKRLRYSCVCMRRLQDAISY